MPFIAAKFGMRFVGPMHRIVIALFIVAGFGAPVLAAEDAAHRADRLRTEQLNRSAGAVVDRRNGRNAAGQERYRQARAHYALKMQAWRRQVAACRAGDYSACERR